MNNNSEIFNNIYTMTLNDLKTNLNLIDINILDKHNQNLLVYAIRLDNYELVEYLIDNKCNLNISLKYNNNLLHEACNIGNLKIIKLIIDKNIKLVKQPNIFGLFPIHIASTRNNTDVIDLLINSNQIEILSCDLNGHNILNHAIKSGKIDVLKHIVKYFNNFKFVDKDGKNLFNYACQFENVEIIEYLTTININIKECDFNRNNPLHTALKNDNSNIIKFLLSKGISKGVINLDNKTPIDIAKERCLFDVVHIIDNFNSKEKTIHKIVDSNDYIRFKLYLKENNNINIRNNHNETALHNAVYNKNHKFIKLLLMNGIEINNDLDNNIFDCSYSNVEELIKKYK